MKKIFTPLCITFLSTLGLSGTSFGQVPLAIYNFNGTGAEDCTNRILSPESEVANLTFSDFSISNVTCVVTANQFNNKDWNAAADVDPTEYVEFSVTANTGFELNLDSLLFDVRSSQLNGHLHVRSSLDNYAADIVGFEYYDGIGWTAVGTIDIPDAYLSFRKGFGASYEGLNAITFRFYATDIAATTTTVRLDNVIPVGTVTVDNNVSVNTLEATAFSVSPNPGTDALTIVSKNQADDLNIRIFTANGKLVSDENMPATGSHMINTSKFDSGLYFIEVSGQEGKTTQRWIKK